MKKLFLGAAALMALAAPGVSAAQTGYIGADYGSTDIDGLGSDDAWGVSGAVELTPNVAIDAGVTDNDSDTAWGATGHLYTNNDARLLGGFVGVSDSDVSTSWTVGAEGQWYFGDTTLAAAASYANDDDNEVDAYGVNGEIRYFVDQNFRIEGGLGWFNLDTPVGDDTAVSLGVGGEFQFTSAPISLGVGYTRTQTDDTDIEADTVTATARWNFGGGTLHDRDHTGAALAGLSGIGAALGL